MLALFCGLTSRAVRLLQFVMLGSHMRRNYLSHRRDNSIPGGSSTWDTVRTNEKILHSEQQTTEMACNTATPSRLYWSYLAGSSPFTAIE